MTELVALIYNAAALQRIKQYSETLFQSLAVS
jgi:hypothetical protein